MSDHKEETQLNITDLTQVRSLIGDAGRGDFTLEDILAEYNTDDPNRLTFRSKRTADREETEDSGAEADLPWPKPPHTHIGTPDNVVAFPGPEEDGPEEEADADEPEDEESEEETEEEDSNVLPFPPQPEPGLKGVARKLRQKGDDFSSQMFQEGADTREARRLEKLIPGTDEEDMDREPIRPSQFQFRLPQFPPVRTPEDCSPRELFRTVSQSRKKLRERSLLTLLLTALALLQALLPASLLGHLGLLGHPRTQVLAAILLTAAGLLLAGDVLLDSLRQALKGFLGPELLTGLAGVCTILDGVILIAAPGRVTRLPFAPVALAALCCLLFGAYHRKMAVRLSCRTAATASEPFRVTLDAQKWNSQDTYVKWKGDQTGFSAQMQTMDGAQRIFCRLCPFLLIADVVLAVLNSFVAKNAAQLFWALSAMLLASAAFGSSLVYSRSFHKIAGRLARSGAALAGWPAAEHAHRGSRVLLTDNDLFPTGSVTMNGYKVMHGFSGERVLACTATMIRDSGSGLEKLFHDQLRAVGGRFRTADHLTHYDGGGMSANIRGDQVLVGCARFMVLQKIVLPTDLNVENGVFCAINGELAGIFALNYALPDAVLPSVEELLENRVSPILATRDFNLIPELLQRRFQLPANRMDFPPVARRRELSAEEGGHSRTLTGLLCREGLVPFADTISTAKRLRRATLLGTWLCCFSSVLGLLLTAYLTSISAFTSLSPLNLLVYMLTWLIPVWLLSSWAHRY